MRRASYAAVMSGFYDYAVLIRLSDQPSHRVLYKQPGDIQLPWGEGSGSVLLMHLSELDDPGLGRKTESDGTGNMSC